MTAPRDRDRISPAVAVRPIVAVDAQHQWSQQLSFQDACGGREAVKRPPGRRRRQHRRRVHAAKLALARRRLRVAGGGRPVPIAWRSTRRREVRESQRAERNNEGQVFKWQPPRLSERAVNAVVALTYQALGVAEIVGDIDDLHSLSIKRKVAGLPPLMLKAMRVAAVLHLASDELRLRMAGEAER
jgi:hypothetical protein